MKSRKNRVCVPAAFVRRLQASLLTLVSLTRAAFKYGNRMGIIGLLTEIPERPLYCFHEITHRSIRSPCRKEYTRIAVLELNGDVAPSTEDALVSFGLPHLDFVFETALRARKTDPRSLKLVPQRAH